MSFAAGDVVTTTDGSRLVGTVEKIADGKLVIVTAIAGRLEIDASVVDSITTQGKVSVEFETGDTLVGVIEKDEGSDSLVVHSALGDISVSMQDVTLLWPEGSENPRIVAVKAEADARIEAMKPKWTATLEGGATRTEGNTDNLEGHVRFDALRKTTEDLLHFYLAAQYNEQNDVRTTNEYRGGIQYENKISDRWYWYTRLGLEFDEFEALDLRATATAGAGYHWLKQDDHELKTRVGFGYRHEAYKNADTRDDAVFELGLDYHVDIADWVKLTHSTIYSPDIEDTANYRVDFDTAFVFPLQNSRWSWKLGMRNEYNSRPQPGFDRLDNTYYTSLMLSLK